MNDFGIFTWDVKVVCGEYDDEKHSWMYTLKDNKDQPIAGKTPEIQLG